MSIEGKVALITAAAAGVGKATAQLFHKRGAKVIMTDIALEQLLEARDALAADGPATPPEALRCDVGSLESIDEVFEQVKKTHGKLDILVNNAGISGPTKNIAEITPEEWDTVFRVNVRGQFYAIRKAAPLMIAAGSGKIVNVSSMAAKMTLPNRAPYNASKMAIISLSRSAAVDLAPHNITVNTVLPGSVDGERFMNVSRAAAERLGMTLEEYLEMRLHQVPLRRFSPPSDIAEMILFLCDQERSNTITGEDINVTAGRVMW